MEYRDYYAVLGVPRTASQADIKKAFRKLARQHHPDVNKGDAAAEQRFKEINEAHAVLGDPEKRKAYDSLGTNWEAYQRAAESGAAGDTGGDPFAGYGGFRGFPGGAPGGVRYEYRGSAEDLAGFSDFFRTFFAGSAAPGSARPGGARPGPAATRQASGGSIDDLLAGLGGVDMELDGQRMVRPRQDAEAEAEISLEEAFHGTQRRVEIEGRRLDISIPRGVDTRRRIRLSGKAGVGPDAGDLYLRVKVRAHAVFTRSDADLRRELRVTLGEALFGGEVPVQTLKSRVLLNLPAGTQTGRVFRLKGQGMPRFGAADGEAPAGDMLVTIRVVLPTDLDAAAQEAGRRFIELARQPDPRA
ncbi:DnaJ C-terminal domain-containing protein [soil metagenome]